MADSKISQLPTGTVDAVNALIPMDINMNTVPKTVQVPITQFYNPAEIYGLNISYTTSGSLSVQSGGAFILSQNKLIHATGTMTANITPVATNTSGSWQHVYMYDNNGLPTIEVVITAPSTPYAGVARTKSGDTSRRYLGSVYCDAGGYLYHFNSNVQGNIWRLNWVEASNVFPFQFANVSGTVATPTSISISWLIPSTSGLVIEGVVQTVHSLAAGGDNVVSIHDGSDSNEVNNVYAEALTRFTSNTATSIQLAPVPIKISSNSYKYTHTNVAQTNGAFFRLRGVNIQR